MNIMNVIYNLLWCSTGSKRLVLINMVTQGILEKGLTLLTQGFLQHIILRKILNKTLNKWVDNYFLKVGFGLSRQGQLVGSLFKKEPQ